MTETLEILAETPLPTDFGEFSCIAFRYGADPLESHLAMVHGDVSGLEEVPVRVHSECFTGEVLRSSKCDCRHQLLTALEHIAEHGAGVLVYLRQEGRGIGLVNKLRAYALQHHDGLDTVDANRHLGLPDDARSYAAAAAILRRLGVSSVALLTNNPLKVEGLRAGGVEVARRVSVLAATTEQARSYLATKISRMGHVVDATPLAPGEVTGEATPEADAPPNKSVA